MPEYREFERTSHHGHQRLRAAVGGCYLQRLEGCAARCIRAHPRLQSNGGAIGLHQARTKRRIVLSGPAGGVVGVRTGPTGDGRSAPNVLTFGMGGTRHGCGALPGRHSHDGRAPSPACHCASPSSTSTR
ncbi:MAG: hydantoinase/oxoprolinase family protein [Caldilineaceae bacterium]